MEYGKIISVTGMPGLYELLSSKNDGAIVRSLDDKSTKFVSSRVHNFSHLESIEIYTVRDNVNLVEVFQAMDKSSEALPDGKDAAKLKKYFESVYPDIDFERVYNSDLKKMAKWLQVLKSNDVELKLTEYPEADETSEVAEEEVTEAKPAKKAAKAAEETEEAPKKKAAKETEEAKPAKKTAKAEETEEAPKKKAAPKAKKEEDETKEPVKKKAAPKKKS
ncbi:MAG: DUF5606 domain-containing protein [Flavitalea sp.]